MKHQIKIIIDYEEEGIDCDETHIKRTIVWVDEQPIGCIQQLSFKANAKSQFHQIEKFEIVFPDFQNSQIDKSFITGFPSQVKGYIKLLSNIPNLDVKLQKLETQSKTYELTEIGTDGCIEHIPMKT